MKRSLTALALVIAATAGGLGWYLHDKQPQRDGELLLGALQAPVAVDYDERGVPHIRAENEADMYRALGFVHAQDRLFQMELLRRLARGELAEVLGEKLLPRSEEHTSELQSRENLVCRLLLEQKTRT